jgi:hypothetical protein
MQLVQINRWKPVSVSLIVEATHSNFSKITWMESIPQVPVVKQTTCLAAPAWMLPVLSHSAMTAADMSTHPSILAETGYHLFIPVLSHNYLKCGNFVLPSLLLVSACSYGLALLM